MAIEANVNDELWAHEDMDELRTHASARWTCSEDNAVVWLGEGGGHEQGHDLRLEEEEFLGQAGGQQQHGAHGSGGRDPDRHLEQEVCAVRHGSDELERTDHDDYGGECQGHRGCGDAGENRGDQQHDARGSGGRDPDRLMEQTVCVVRHESGQRGHGDERYGARGIKFKDGVKPEVASALRRLHQNMGHPDPHELARHLRLAGADASVVAAAKSLSCDTCSRHRRGGQARPSSMPNLLAFNQVVGVDSFSIYDMNGGRHDILSAVDFSSTFHLCTVVHGHDAASLEKAFVGLWVNVFGAPQSLAVDLETGLQAAFGNLSTWFGTKIRPSAGQAHWQQGITERHDGGVWKEMFVKVNDEHSATASEIPMCVAAVNSAKNQLRRVSGYSPSQIVWGRDPVTPGELLGDGNPEQEEHILTRDQARAREHTIRCAAKAAFFKCQTDQRLRRALLQRSRVAPGTVSVGDIVYFLRKPKNAKDWVWKGPATVIGNEGPNSWVSWVSFAGRCHLCAGEHLRLATGEELGEAFTIRSTRDDLLRLVEGDPDDLGHFIGERLEGSGRQRRQDDQGLPPDPELPPGDVFANADDQEIPDYMSETYRLTDQEDEPMAEKDEPLKPDHQFLKGCAKRGPKLLQQLEGSMKPTC